MAIDKKKLAAFGNQKNKSPQAPSKTAPKPGKKGKDEDEHEETNPGEGDHKEPDDDDEEGGGDDVPDVHAISEKVQSGELDDDELTKMAMQLTDEDDVPDWATDIEKWDSSVDLVEPMWDELDHPWVVVAHVYDAMGGQVEGADDDAEGNEDDAPNDKKKKDAAEGGKGGKHKGPPVGQDGGGGN